MREGNVFSISVCQQVGPAGPGQGPGAPPPGQGKGAPWSRSKSRSGGTPVKVQVKIRGPPWSRSRSRSGGPPGQSLSGTPPPAVKVQVKVWGASPGQGLGQGPGQGLGPPPPCLGSKMRGARAVRLLRSRRRTVFLIYNLVPNSLQFFAIIRNSFSQRHVRRI